jgi:hypothetical protein
MVHMHCRRDEMGGKKNGAPQKAERRQKDL